MHLPGSTYSKISSLFCGRFRIASIGQYRGNGGVAFIFTFDAEMVAGHVHLCWFGTGFYAVKRMKTARIWNAWMAEKSG
jgi:hypothetical protein